MAEDGPILTYTFHNTKPVALSTLTASLDAVSEQYLGFVRRQGGELSEDGYQLYVREIRAGSVVVDLIGQAMQSPMFAPFAPFVIPFAQNLSDWFEVFKGAKDTLELKEMLFGSSKKELQQLSQIVEPAAVDHGSSINITATHGGVIIINAPLTSIEANAGQNVLRRHIGGVALPVSGVRHDQVLAWYQMRDDQAAKPGDKAVIERIWPHPVKVRITSDEIKRQMLDKADNPFRKLYVVDVDVTESNGKPVLYKILEVKDTIDQDETV